MNFLNRKRQHSWSPWAAVLAGALGLSLGSAIAQEEPLQSQMDVYVIETDRNGEELARPAREVEPGQVLEYRITYRNVSSKPLKKLVVTGPVPAATEFVPGSPRTRVAAELQASIDQGKSYATPPLYRWVMTPEGRRVREEVPPQEYTHVRWQAQGMFPGFGVQEYRYRVRVK